MDIRKIPKFNWILIGILLLLFSQEYRILLDGFEKQNLISVERDFRTISTGVSSMLNNYQYGTAITTYRIETLSRQMLRYNINYVNEKILGDVLRSPEALTKEVRQVMEIGSFDDFIIMGLYDNKTQTFLVGNEYFKVESPVSSSKLQTLMNDAKRKGEAFNSFALSKDADVFNRIDVFARYNPALQVTVLGAIPRVFLKNVYEDNVSISVVRGELLGNHSPEKEGNILIYDSAGNLLTTNWAHDGKEAFLHDDKGRSLYTLLENQQEKVIRYKVQSAESGLVDYYAYGDVSGDNFVVVVKDQRTEDKHEHGAVVLLNIVTVIMFLVTAALVQLVLSAKPLENNRE